MPMQKYPTKPTHPLSTDINKRELVIDDLDSGLTPIGPSRYAMLATDDPHTCTIARSERDDPLPPQFVCSYDDNVLARNHVSKMNANRNRTHERMIDEGVSMLSNDEPMTDAEIIFGSLIITGYLDYTAEFQHLLDAYRQYTTVEDPLHRTPYTLTRSFKELMKINKLAPAYLSVANIIATTPKVTSEEERVLLVSKIVAAIT